MKNPRPSYTVEFRGLAVSRVKSGQSISLVARELGLVDQTLRHWVKAAERGPLTGVGQPAITPEAMAFSRLRAENARLTRELEILKKAGRTSRERRYEVRRDCSAGGIIYAERVLPRLKVPRGVRAGCVNSGIVPRPARVELSGGCGYTASERVISGVTR